MAEAKRVNFIHLCYHQGFIIFQGSVGAYKSKPQSKSCLKAQTNSVQSVILPHFLFILTLICSLINFSPIQACFFLIVLVQQYMYLVEGNWETFVPLSRQSASLFTVPKKKSFSHLIHEGFVIFSSTVRE